MNFPHPEELLGHAWGMKERTWVCDGSDAVKVSERTIIMTAYAAGDEVEIIGRLTDARVRTVPEGPTGPVHDMELRLAIQRADYVIVGVQAKMFSTPHFDCLDIEPAFDQLLGVSVARGYSKTVQERLGRERGCSHLEFLARAMGTVALQGIATSNGLNKTEEDGPADYSPGPWMKNTCHLWAEGGIAEQKLELGWKPGSISPVPPLAEWKAGRVPVAVRSINDEGT